MQKEMYPERKTFEQLIKEAVYRVPEFQRPYSWEKEQLSDLWYDIEDLDEQRKHFMGTIVLVPDHEGAGKVVDGPSSYVIIDGQQRIATLLILLAAIRDKALTLRNGRRSQGTNPEQDDPVECLVRDIHDIIEYRRQPRPYREGFRFRVGESDRKFLQNYIFRPPGDEEREKAHKQYVQRGRKDPKYKRTLVRNRIKKAYEYFVEMLERVRDIEQLQALVGKILYNLVFVRIIAETEGDALTIFETLNDRGLPLAAVDLIKNHLCRSARQEDSKVDMKEISRKWDDEIISPLDVGGKNYASEFILHYLRTTHDMVRRDDLYDSFKKALKSRSCKGGIYQFLDYLGQTASEFYRYLLSPDQIPNSGEKSIWIEPFWALKLMDARRCYPYIMAVWLQEKRFDLVAEAASLAENVTFRYWVRHGDMRVLERIFVDAALQVFRDNVDFKEALKQRIKRHDSESPRRFPSDDEFRQAFLSLAADSSKARYILRKLEIYLQQQQDRGRSKEIKKMVEVPPKVSVEHIIPKGGLPDEWRGYLVREGIKEEDIDEQYEMTRDLLGNLILLDIDINKKARTQTYDKKVKYYKGSSLLQVQQLIEKYRQWTFVRIRDRQKEIADLAPQIWPNLLK